MKPFWRNRDYRLFWSGNLVSSVGSMTVLVALPLLVLAVTSKPLHAGGVAAVEAQIRLDPSTVSHVLLGAVMSTC